MPLCYSQSVREDVATRLSANQPPKLISGALNVSLKTVYRLKKTFIRDGDSYVAPPMLKTVREKINREKLLQLSEIMKRDGGNITLKELLAKSVQEGIFESADAAPDISTIYRALKNKVGFKWQVPQYDDPRAQRTRVTYERCEFRRSLQEGLVDPTQTLCQDETSFYIGGEAPTRAWDTLHRRPKIQKNKMGGTKVVMYLTIGYKLNAVGEPLAFVHWLCVPPQRSNKPLSDKIEEWEKEDTTEKRTLREKYTEAYVNSLTAEGMKKELYSISLRSSATTAASMKETLIRVGRSGSRVNELRQRKKGGQEKGELRSHTQTSYYFSEYLSQCLGTYAAGDDLWSAGDNECKLSADLGIRGCPDGGKREYLPSLRDNTLMMDNAAYHQYTTENTVSAFHKWVQDKLGLKGVVFTPAYSSWFNPTEYANSLIKRYVRRHNPQTIPDLLQRIREVTQTITGKFIQGWFKKASFKTGPEVLAQADPNAGVADRCSLPATARFDRREVVMCADDTGSVKREKKARHTRWSKYAEDDAIEGTLENVSLVKRTGIPPRKRPHIESCREPTDGSRLRWIGLGPEPPELVHGDSAGLFQGGDDMAEIERICDEKKTGGGVEYLVRWKGFDASHDEWLKGNDIQGLGSLQQYWRDGNKRASEEKQMRDHKEEGSRPPPPYKPNREPKVGDTVAMYPPKDDEDLVFVGQILEVSPTKFKVHWWSSKKIDGTWSPEFLAKKGKGHAGAYTGSVWREAIIDILLSLHGKKGKIETQQLTEIIKLAKAYKKKS